MNYYKRHIGDYVKDTAHLTLLEHGIYARLLDVYYAREAAIPESQVMRLIGARTKDEIAATLCVLNEFFNTIDGVWHHGRCDLEIASSVGISETNRRIALEREAKKRGTLSPHSSQEACTERDTERDKSVNLATSQQPLANNHYPIKDLTPPQVLEGEMLGTKAGEVCIAMRNVGMGSVNPSHPVLIALLDAGATIPEFISAAAASKGKRKPFEYALSVVKGRRIEAADVAANPGATPTKSDRDQANAETYQALTGKGARAATSSERVIDGTVERLG